MKEKYTFSLYLSCSLLIVSFAWNWVKSALHVFTLNCWVDYFPQWWENMLKIEIVMREKKDSYTYHTYEYGSHCHTCEQSTLVCGGLNFQNILYWTWSFQLNVDSFKEWHKEGNFKKKEEEGSLNPKGPLKAQPPSGFGVRKSRPNRVSLQSSR